MPITSQYFTKKPELWQVVQVTEDLEEMLTFMQGTSPANYQIINDGIEWSTSMFTNYRVTPGMYITKSANSGWGASSSYPWDAYSNMQEVSSPSASYVLE